jgi:hypothetical protein
LKHSKGNIFSTKKRLKPQTNYYGILLIYSLEIDQGTKLKMKSLFEKLDSSLSETQSNIEERKEEKMNELYETCNELSFMESLEMYQVNILK